MSVAMLVSLLVGLGVMDVVLLFLVVGVYRRQETLEKRMRQVLHKKKVRRTKK